MPWAVCQPPLPPLVSRLHLGASPKGGGHRGAEGSCFSTITRFICPGGEGGGCLPPSPCGSPSLSMGPLTSGGLPEVRTKTRKARDADRVVPLLEENDHSLPLFFFATQNNPTDGWPAKLRPPSPFPPPPSPAARDEVRDRIMPINRRYPPGRPPLPKARSLPQSQYISKLG